MAAYTAIDDPGTLFNTKLWTGTSAIHEITGMGFQPDLIWGKCRDAGSRSHVWTDSVRGTDSQLSCDNTDAQTTYTNVVTAFGADGFTMGADTATGEMNESTDTFVGWNWKAGTTSGIGGSPSITPTGYSFNQAAGFSIIAYTGTGANATLPHGLGVAPDFIITKELDAGGNDWGVFHASLGATKAAWLNTTTAAGTSASYWNDTAPTSTLFTVGTNTQSNGSGTDYVAYCFAQKQGFSRFGSYYGNGSSDGTVVNLGFRPAWTMITSVTGSYGWDILDDQRAGFNPDNENLMSNTNGVEDDTNNYWDLMSNGFKIMSSTGNVGTNNYQYLFMAFASNPFVNSSGVPGNAR